jgi:methionine sulfoxide reductase heme-binding subunit
MSGALATIGPSAYWYLARGTGAVALVLLTASVVLGILGSVRFTAPRWPRFAIDSLHRDVSLLVLAVLGLHIITSVLDSFAPIKLTDAVIPFASAYRPLWMGLGALSFDLLLALVITSLMRRRLGYRSWRAIHWLAYASWPIAVFHGLGTGSDAKLWWMLALTAACVAAVVAAVFVRIARAGDSETVRAPVVLLSIATPLAIVFFTVIGPLQPHWARRAGTPSSLLGHSFTPAATSARVRTSSTSKLHVPFSADLHGHVTQHQVSNGAIVDLALRMTGGAHGQLRVRLAGTPVSSGGLSLAGSQVDLLARGLPSVMEGKVIFLEGGRVVAHVVGSDGSTLQLRADLNINNSDDAVTGTLHATRGGG